MVQRPYRSGAIRDRYGFKNILCYGSAGVKPGMHQAGSYLKTSYVMVQHHQNQRAPTTHHHLKTSYVMVQLCASNILFFSAII